MPLQNRGTPFGDIVATPERGTMMGNRGGCLHDSQRRLGRRRWVGERWIACELSFRGRWREVMHPGRYTELFFLDEATALAAGHRPCAECRRDDFRRFRAAWHRGNPGLADPAGSIALLDRVLHGERTTANPSQTRVDALPSGVFVAFGSHPGVAFLIQDGSVRPWTPGGYRPPARPPGAFCFLLTPPSIAAAIAAGYGPRIQLAEGGTTDI